MLPETFWLAVTSLGRDEVFIAVLALYTWLVSPRGTRQLGVAFALSFLVNSALKYGINAPRPFAADPSLASEAARATAGGPSFPSGHAQMSATLWGGMAAQLRNRVLTVIAAVLVALIAYSRLALQVHSPLDVLAGLGLGLVFALVAGAQIPQLPANAAWRWGVPAALLLTALALPAGVPRELPSGLGMLAGFWAIAPNYRPPRTWLSCVVVAVLGLTLVLGLYVALSVLLPEAWKALPFVTTLRYTTLVLFAGEGIPRLLGRWLPPQEAMQREAALQSL